MQSVIWTGKAPRTNSFGTFLPNVAVRVTEDVAKQLLQVKSFRLASTNEAAAVNASDASLKELVSGLEQDNQTLVERVTELEDQLRIVGEELGALRLAVPTEEEDTEEDTEEDNVEGGE